VKVHNALKPLSRKLATQLLALWIAKLGNGPSSVLARRHVVEDKNTGREQFNPLQWAERCVPKDLTLLNQQFAPPNLAALQSQSAQMEGFQLTILLNALTV